MQILDTTALIPPDLFCHQYIEDKMKKLKSTKKMKATKGTYENSEIALNETIVAKDESPYDLVVINTKLGLSGREDHQ